LAQLEIGLPHSTKVELCWDTNPGLFFPLNRKTWLTFHGMSEWQLSQLTHGSNTLGRSTFTSTGSSSILGFSRQKALQKMSSAVGLGLDQLVKPRRPETSHLHQELCSSTLHFSAGKLMKPSRLERPPSNRPRFLATAYDSDWKLRSEQAAKQRTGDNEEPQDWLHSVLGKKKRKGQPMGQRMRSDLVAAILEDGGITDDPFAWDPLRDLKIQGPQESDSSSESSTSMSSESLDIKTLAIVARLGRRRSSMQGNVRASVRETREQKNQRRASKALTLRREKTKDMPKKVAPPERLTLAKLSGKHNIPMQVSEQAFNWWFSFATSDGFIGTEADVLDGMEFDVPSLGLMSHDAFIQACCAISDVDNPKLLDMEFVGSVLLSAAECLENFTNSGRDPEDESLNGQLDFVEFLTFFHKFCFSEEVLISREERELRRLARKHGFSFLDIDSLKKDFDKADRRGEGKLKHDEFHELMARLMKLPVGQELPDKKKKELWISATQGWRKQLDLDAFLGFYAQFGR